MPNQEHDLSIDNIYLDTALGWAQTYLEGLLELTSGYLTKGNARHASLDMSKKEPDKALICIDPSDSPNLVKQELDRVPIFSDLLDPDALAIDRALSQTDPHSIKADLIQIFIKTLEGRHIHWRIWKGKRI